MCALAVGGALLGGFVPGARAVEPSTNGNNATSRPRKTALGSGPVEESQSERRAVRGSSVEEGIESPELSELRRFEDEMFPRTRGEGDDAAGGTAPAPPAGLPGRWDGSGDVPEVLRSSDTAPARTAPTMPDSEWLRGLTLPELPVRWDPRVLRYLDYFRSDPRGRAVMTNWLRRAGRYRAIIENAMVREGVPKDLLYVAMIESGFEPTARSRVGAGGIWQFMPGAARAYGLEVGYWIDARRDPERQSEAAARYLKDLYVRFGSWPLVFAAYNAGYGAVLKSITRYNTNDYWELCRHEAGLPWESNLYVPKILAAAIVGHNLAAFGFGEVVPDPPLVYDKVEVPPGTTLATVARAARVRPELVEALNSHISRGRTPPDRAAYPVRLPAGSGAAYVEAFERTRGPGDRLETVTLRFGETLEDVARAHGTTARELRRLNGVKDSGDLKAGVAIVCPRRKGAAPDEPGAGAGAWSPPTPPGAERDAGGAPAGVASAGVDGAEDEEVLVAVPDRTFSYEGRERVFYRTREGDTLDAIAGVLAVRVDDLVTWNNLDPQARLHPRMVLQAFVRKDYDPTQVVLLDPARVRVVTLGSEEFLDLEAARRGKKRLVVEAKANDTLAKLGRRFGLTVGDLARINRFSSSTELHEGQRVVVYSPVGERGRDVAQGMGSGPPRRDRGGGGEGLHGAAGGSPRALPKVTAKLERLERLARLEKAEKAEKAERGDKPDKAEKNDRSERGDKTERGGERERSASVKSAGGTVSSVKITARSTPAVATERDRKDKVERPAPRAGAKAPAASALRATPKKK